MLSFRILLLWSIILWSAVRTGHTADATRHFPAERLYRFSSRPADSLRFARPRNFFSTRGFQIVGVGIPLLAGSALVQNTNIRFKELRDNSIPNFHSKYDDWLQYAPAAVMIGLKAANVSGRSSWGRMLVSDAFSVTAMAILVNSVKYSVKKERPDGSAANSYPSGHTATAFMTATMLSREYGGRSIWYSIGAYTAATAVGVGRITNNRHWLGDVLAGAGIGIISTELGYWIADQLFKDKGIDRRFDPQNILYEPNRPSFIGIYLGNRMTPGNYRTPDGAKLAIGTGSVAGLEGAWFFTRHVGIGGRFTLSGMPVAVTGTSEEYLNNISASVGSYFFYPIGPVFGLGGRLAIGYTRYEQGTASPGIVSVAKRDGLALESGIAMQFRIRRHFGFRLCFDYQAQTSPFTGNCRWLHNLCYGMSANILF